LLAAEHHRSAVFAIHICKKAEFAMPMHAGEVSRTNHARPLHVAGAVTLSLIAGTVGCVSHSVSTERDIAAAATNSHTDAKSAKQADAKLASRGDLQAESAGEFNLDDTPPTARALTQPTVGADFNPVLSRDGKLLVYASTQHRKTADLYARVPGASSTVQLTQDGANDVMPAISPDGSRIAFASDRSGKYQIYLMAATGGPAISLTTGMHDLHPSFSADGQRLAFCRMGEASGRWEMWVIEIKRPSVPEFIGYGMMPEFSPVAAAGEGQSERIAFQRARQRSDQAYSIWTVDYKPGSVSNPVEIVPANEFAAITPRWSPDGQWIAFCAVPLSSADVASRMPAASSNRAGEYYAANSPVSGQIRAVMADGSLQVTLTDAVRTAFMPAWSKDGSLVFVNTQPGRTGLWSVQTDRAMAATRDQQPVTVQANENMAHDGAGHANTKPSHAPAPAPMPVAAQPQPAAKLPAQANAAAAPASPADPVHTEASAPTTQPSPADPEH